MTTETKLPPIHPGEVLNEEFLAPMDITQYRLAKSIGVDPRRIHSIVHGQWSITAETALLLGRFFGNSPGFWMGLQAQYDLEVTQYRLSQPGCTGLGGTETQGAGPGSGNSLTGNTLLTISMSAFGQCGSHVRRHSFPGMW